MKKALFIEGNRNGYHPDQCEHATMTVAGLIDFLQQFEQDALVFLRNDDGYTYGSVDGWNGDICEGVYDDDTVLLDDGSEEYWDAVYARETDVA